MGEKLSVETKKKRRRRKCTAHGPSEELRPMNAYINPSVLLGVFVII